MTKWNSSYFQRKKRETNYISFFFANLKRIMFMFFRFMWITFYFDTIKTFVIINTHSYALTHAQTHEALQSFLNSDREIDKVCSKSKIRVGFLVMFLKLSAGVNFINILLVRFSYKSELSSFSQVTFGFVIFLAQKYQQKCTHKMWIKLTPGKKCFF